jgi:hypothetical protein
VEFEFDEDQRLLQHVVRETVAKSRSLPADMLWTTYQELGWLEALLFRSADHESSLWSGDLAV